MWELVRWEWRYCKKSAWRQLVVRAVWLLAVLFLYCFWKEGIFRFTAIVFALPEEVYAFAGLNYNIVTGNCLFYVLYVGMYLNVWMAWNACERTLYLLQEDEQTGSIYILCNQWHSKQRIGRGKLLCSLIVFWGQNTIWHSMALITVLAGSFNADQRLRAVGVILQLWFQTMAVISMLIVLTFTIGSCCRYPMRKGIGGVNVYFAGSLILGNLYKIRDLYRWLTAYFEMPFGYAEQGFEWLDFGYWLSPLSWLNPFSLETEMKFLIQMVICITIVAVGIITGQRIYCQRRFCLL